MARTRRRLLAGVTSLALVGLVACDPVPPPVATFVVDSASDAPDATVGDGTCAVAGGGCSLRAALAEAGVAWDPAVDAPVTRPVVEIAPGVDPELTTGPVTEAGGAIIRGGGATIDADGTSRPLWACGGPLTIEDLTITGAGATGGAIHDPGCAHGAIEVRRVTFTGNAGWAIDAAAATVNVHESRIEGGAGGIRTVTGGTAVVSSTITGTAVPLDVISSLTLLGASVVDNLGGVTVRHDPARGGSVEIVASLVADNGGGITSAAAVRIRSSTISGNAAPIRMTNLVMIVIGSTLVDSGTAGQIEDTGAWISLEASIIGGEGGACPPGERNITSNGWNIATDTSCGFTANGDQQRVDPLLGPLSDEGGPTQVRVPAPGSPAIDAIPITNDRCERMPDDQLLAPRPQGAGCDPGAVEQSGI